MATTKPLFGYWDLRGRGEAIRLLLAHAGVEYDQKLYVCGEGPHFSRADWTDVKDSLSLDFPNLPYYVDGNLRITESWAILKHIARKNDLLTEGKHRSCRSKQLLFHVKVKIF